MNKIKIGTKVRIKGDKGWGDFRGEVTKIDGVKKTASVIIMALGKEHNLVFNLDELVET